MIGGTWKGSNNLYPEGGGGYAFPIPLKKVGYRQSGADKYSFMLWARLEGYADPSQYRMHTDLLHPLIAQVKGTDELEALFKKDAECIKRMSKYHADPLDCAIIKSVYFDYLLLEFSATDVSAINIIGRNLNDAKEVFNITMREK